MIIVTLVLIGLAFLAYRSSTPANQLLLISGILGVLALIAGLSISKLDDQDERAATYRSILDDVRKSAKVSVNYGEPDVQHVDAAMPNDADKGPAISVSFADPEVHHVDSAMLDTAKRMAEDGAPIDDICREIDRDHDSHYPVHQEAFRRVVRAMIEQA